MDQLLAQSGKGSVLISSSGFPDETDDIDVGADDMLINAINQMNRSKPRYVFLDQARISGFGQLEIVTTRKKDEIKPRLYVRGSISQVDDEPSDNALTVGYNRGGETGITDTYIRGSRSLSVVSVDMHLVEFPSRRVLPGASVANSMVVTKRRFEAGAFGIIQAGTFGSPLRIERVESRSQAVRNLIEVGAIELLGRHAGVPFWTCLDAPTTDAKNNEAHERQTRKGSEAARIAEAQDHLTRLGMLRGGENGVLDAQTRRALSTFQGQHNLLPNGVVDFDTLQELRRLAGLKVPAGSNISLTPQVKKPSPVVVSAKPPKTRPLPAVQPEPTIAPSRDPECIEEGDCKEVYKNLYHFLKTLESGG
ncbi:peptidoglycan-binding domain-containing protein [Shimia sp. Alg240-R146]|uniref:peptidoglycan-binding domain-containing protein n=1 Tax=Shimia sp. Alg240-R146 TaxID=2993449 RepID=UPI0022DEDBA0|nr:peptidoglycan-binding domain-containing protein [Shimia sp. Alg240-R146]